MKNRTTKTTTWEPRPQVNNKKAMIGSPRAYEERRFEKSRESMPPPTALKPKKAKELGMIDQGVMSEAPLQRYNAMPFKNNAINLFDRQRYGISREFDGQEVEGTMMERPTAGGGRMEVERFNNMPGGGRRMERTRYNDQGMPVNRTIKDRGIN
jgi:hypothetical protein